MADGERRERKRHWAPFDHILTWCGRHREDVTMAGSYNHVTCLTCLNRWLTEIERDRRFVKETIRRLTS